MIYQQTSPMVSVTFTSSLPPQSQFNFMLVGPQASDGFTCIRVLYIKKSKFCFDSNSVRTALADLGLHLSTCMKPLFTQQGPFIWCSNPLLQRKIFIKTRLSVKLILWSSTMSFVDVRVHSNMGTRHWANTALKDQKHIPWKINDYRVKFFSDSRALNSIKNKNLDWRTERRSWILIVFDH